MNLKLMAFSCMLASGFCALGNDYYVDSVKGDDSLDGRSQNTPWRTLDKVNKAALQPGDRVLLKRGGLWRETLHLRSGSEDKPLIYSHYGDGPLPLIQPSVSASDPADWKEASDGIWTLTEKAAEAISVDVGNIVFDHGAATCGWKRWKAEDLKKDGEYVYLWKTHNILLKYPENPAKRHKSVELVLRRFGVIHDNAHDVIVDGLAIRYAGCHGFGGSNPKRYTIRNCEISYVGGAHQFTTQDGRNVRFGNGIEFWNSASDCLIENNRIWEIYDAALTNQGRANKPEAPSVERNITYRNNTVWNAEYSFEYWNNPEYSITENILVENNTFVDAGYGWAHAQRPDVNGAHIMAYSNIAQTKNFVFRNNIFFNSTEVCLRIFNDWKPETAVFENNLWENGEKPFIRSEIKTQKGMFNKTAFSDFLKQRNPNVHEMTGVPRFVDAANHDYRLAPESVGYGKNVGANPKIMQ